jgi:dihydroorotate dehydrogenase
MSVSSAVAKALLRLPPERAHHLAIALLGLPAPWARIGGAVDDPLLQVDLAGVPLRNPIGLAAGFDKACRRLDVLGRLGFGYVVGGTITLRPRDGNPRPRIARLPERRSLVNAMGLPNPGAEAAARSLARAQPTAPRFASIADQDRSEAIQTHALLEPHVDAIELNASCPNVSWGRERDNEQHLGTLVRELGSRRSKPLLVKLPPFRTAVERDVVVALARIAVEAGADGLTCSNTRQVADARLSTGRGGLSGRDLFGDTPATVHAVRTATEGAVPIVACGGIGSAADVVACLEAGATTVQLYTALVYEGPTLVATITRDLRSLLRDRRTAVPQLVGTA